MRTSVSKIPFLSHYPSSSSAVIGIIIGLLLKTRHFLLTALAVKKSKFIRLSCLLSVCYLCCLLSVCYLLFVYCLLSLLSSCLLSAACCTLSSVNCLLSVFSVVCCLLCGCLPSDYLLSVFCMLRTWFLVVSSWDRTKANLSHVCF